MNNLKITYNGNGNCEGSGNTFYNQGVPSEMQGNPFTSKSEYDCVNWVITNAKKGDTLTSSNPIASVFVVGIY